MWKFLKKSRAVLGLNSRNLAFVRPGNKRSALEIVDNKLQTKRLLQKFNLPAANLLGVIKTRRDFYNFDWQSLPNSFVLKPNRGLGGEGIMVTFGRKKNGRWILPHARTVSLLDVMNHVRDILDGHYSMAGAPDAAFFETRLKIHPDFKLYSYKGIPDVRVIVYNKVPVMAMLRLPTRASHGTANLHKGGIGLGIDIAAGVTTHAIQNDRVIQYLPDLKLPLRGLKIPFWDQILEMAVKSAEACGLNYTGVDIAVDREQGPMILELNGHPGLSIQIANLAPLKERLLRVRGLKIKTVSKGIAVGKELFGDPEIEAEKYRSRQVIGVRNKIKLIGRGGRSAEVDAKMDTGAAMTSIDEKLARELGFGEAMDYFATFDLDRVLSSEDLAALREAKINDKICQHPDIVDSAVIFSSHGASLRPEIEIKLIINDREIVSRANVITRRRLRCPVIVGCRDLRGFLIAPDKS